MKLLKPTFAVLLAGSFAFLSCNNEAGSDEKNADEKADSTSLEQGRADSAAIKEEAVTYSANGTTLKGFVSLRFHKTKQTSHCIGSAGVVGPHRLSPHEGPAISAVGYLAMAVDMYGNGKIAENPDEALKSATPFYKDPQEAKARLEAALAKAKTYPRPTLHKRPLSVIVSGAPWY